MGRYRSRHRLSVHISSATALSNIPLLTQRITYTPRSVAHIILALAQSYAPAIPIL